MPKNFAGKKISFGTQTDFREMEVQTDPCTISYDDDDVVKWVLLGFCLAFELCFGFGSPLLWPNASRNGFLVTSNKLGSKMFAPACVAALSAARKSFDANLSMKFASGLAFEAC